MTVGNLKSGKKLDVSFDAWLLLQNEKTELIHFVLQAGEKIEKHGNPVDVCFFIQKGEGLLIMNDFSYYLGVGDTIFVPKGAAREWINEGKDILEVLVIKYL